MGITEKEEQLFSVWRELRDQFVADGVVDEAAYLASEPKVMFVMKEVNSPENGGWDLRQFLREEGGRKATWDNVARWVEGIRRLPEDVQWDELASISPEHRILILRSIVSVNLKKSPGSYATNRAELTKVAEEDKRHLNTQFLLYEADLVICCGSDVTETFHWLVDSCGSPDWRNTGRGVEYHEYAPGKYVIAYSHPAARVSPNLLYYGLIDAVRSICNL